ncbi:MAG: hypothetical protein KJ706_04895 [Candidatus Omnitrophica bacterium]|nr:hypothetical protein [Candidatus Omnitrophota bacterium]
MKINLKKKFPKKVFDIVKAAGALADKENIPAYIVGGPVRDLLLDLSNYDLDFVVEGDAIAFARKLSRSLKGGLKTYRAFKTATVTYGDFRIDIVTARTETYKRPGSYPDVKPGTIKQDLFRRDFTVNAMAVSINKRKFGELVDFYNGLQDLRKGVVRVMHDKSFMDDPTRIFRAVRFCARFNFRIERHTKALMKKAALAGFLGEVNRGRIRKEVELFLKEKAPLKCLKSFSRLI